MTMAFHCIIILVIGLAAVTAQDTNTTVTTENPNTLQTTFSVNFTQSVNSTTASGPLSATPANTSLSTVSPDTTEDFTISTMTGEKDYTPAKNGTTIPLATQEKMTTTAGSTKTVASPSSEPDNTTGIVILVIIIVVALGFGLACYFAKKKGRHYSVDFTSRPEEANIPLSAVEPDPPVDAAFQNGLQTFESPGAASNQAQEAETTPEAEEEQKAEAEKSPANPNAESAAPEATPPDKPKEDVAEPSSPAAAEPTVEEKTDDEGVESNKTSVESLKETNVNNSNSRDLVPQREFESSDLLWDVVSTSV